MAIIAETNKWINTRLYLRLLQKQAMLEPINARINTPRNILKITLLILLLMPSPITYKKRLWQCLTEIRLLQSWKKEALRSNVRWSQTNSETELRIIMRRKILNGATSKEQISMEKSKNIHCLSSARRESCNHQRITNIQEGKKCCCHWIHLKRSRIL